MKLRKFELCDYEEVVTMYQDLTKEIYFDRTIGEKYFFYRSVSSWIDSGKDIIVCEKDGQLLGFTLGFVDNCGGITNAVYSGEIAFVKPEYRKTRAAYLLYHNVSDYANEQGLTLIANAFLAGENKVDKIQKKLGGTPRFIMMERSK